MSAESGRDLPSLTMEQLRARHALSVVAKAATRGPQDKSAYRRQARRLGPAILMNGLGQAAATLAASSDARPLYDDLSSWLCRKYPRSPYAEQSDLIEAIATGTRNQFMWASEEALSWLEWVKKLAVAQLPDGEEP
jgi:CRISPR type III-B/RAMP module-associated protein Cmr5